MFFVTCMTSYLDIQRCVMRIEGMAKLGDAEKRQVWAGMFSAAIAGGANEDMDEEEFDGFLSNAEDLADGALESYEARFGEKHEEEEEEDERPKRRRKR